MTEIDWGALARRFADDIRTNAPPPAPAGGGLDLPDLLDRIAAALPAWAAAWRAHQGLATGLEDMLGRLDEAGVPHADEFRRALLAIPGAMAAAELWLPRIRWMLSTFAPAPTGLPGALAGARGHI